MKTTLQMRDELGKEGLTISREPCPPPYNGFVFVARHSDSNASVALGELVALIRYLYYVHFMQ